MAGCDHLLNLYIARYGEDILAEEGFDVVNGEAETLRYGSDDEIVWMDSSFEGDEEE